MNEIDAKCSLAKDKKPFFHFSHIKTHAAFNKSMAPYRNAVGFFGHWHASASNWSVIRMWSSGPSIHCPSCAPMGGNSLQPDTCKWAKAPFEKSSPDVLGRNRQGYIVRVYDDMVVFERHEFGKGGKIGADWIMPLGKYDPHPFARQELVKEIGTPQFREGAKLGVECVNPENPADSANGEVVRVTIPLADGNPKCRVFAYDVAVSGKPVKCVFATGCNMGMGHEPNGGVTTVEIARSALPPGDALAFDVRPRSSLGTCGAPIYATLPNQENKKGTQT